MSDVPAGWYPDPSVPTGLRYWDGTAWSDHVAEKGPEPPGGTTNWFAGGLIIFFLSVPAFAVCGLLAAVSSNACGPFADGCDDYGETAPGFALFIAGVVVSAVAGVVGLTLAIVAGVRRSDERVSDRT